MQEGYGMACLCHITCNANDHGLGTQYAHLPNQAPHLSIFIFLSRRIIPLSSHLFRLQWQCLEQLTAGLEARRTSGCGVGGSGQSICGLGGDPAFTSPLARSRPSAQRTSFQQRKHISFILCSYRSRYLTRRTCSADLTDGSNKRGACQQHSKHY